jgi:choline kinase
MPYRVLIPAAGTGSRLGELTRYINKSLVSVDNRPAICHIIEQFPEDAEFVIALGHKGDLVRDFLDMAYPERKFCYSFVSPFEGEGSGLGLSILSCREHLETSFIFISCDTLVRGKIPDLSRNWAGYAERADVSQYRTLRIENEHVVEICEKGAAHSDAHKPYIGLAGIVDYADFWEAMSSGGSDAVNMGEAFGLRSIAGRGIDAVRFTWYDTGNMEGLAAARVAYGSEGSPNILEKPNEAIWFVGNSVIKFSDDKKFIENRVKRARRLLDYVPHITAEKDNLYSYDKVEGVTLSGSINIPLFQKLLDWCRRFWVRSDLDASALVAFKKQCMEFYREKTFERIALFYDKFQKTDDAEVINGAAMPRLDEMLGRMDWDWLADGIPGRFHGDFHFENILYSEETGKFTFIDWRQEFGHSLDVGDIYYDLAKLLHGLIVCHELIARGQYCAEWKDGAIDFDFNRKQILVECEGYYFDWLTGSGYDLKKVRILTALVYLNIAALHHYPYCMLLYALGKQMLFYGLGDGLRQ